MDRTIHQIIVVFIDFIDFISFLNTLLKTLPNREYSNLTCSTAPGLYPKYSPIKYSYFSNSLDDNEEILAASLSGSY